ncbi:hypothetical protein PFISCL1PPCAC_9147, partial [Pristionchus fissidentatus]
AAPPPAMYSLTAASSALCNLVMTQSLTFFSSSTAFFSSLVRFLRGILSSRFSSSSSTAFSLSSGASKGLAQSITGFSYRATVEAGFGGSIFVSSEGGAGAMMRGWTTGFCSFFLSSSSLFSSAQWPKARVSGSSTRATGAIGAQRQRDN